MYGSIIVIILNLEQNLLYWYSLEINPLVQIVKAKTNPIYQQMPQMNVIRTISVPQILYKYIFVIFFLFQICNIVGRINLSP